MDEYHEKVTRGVYLCKKDDMLPYKLFTARLPIWLEVRIMDLLETKDFREALRIIKEAHKVKDIYKSFDFTCVNKREANKIINYTLNYKDLNFFKEEIINK